MIDTQSADLIARAINARNAERASRAESAADLVVALVLAILGTLALLHFATPCGASLCALAAIPTRRNPLRRLADAIAAWHLRVRINAAEADAAHHEEMAELAPQLATLARGYAAELRVQLASIEAR